MKKLMLITGVLITSMSFGAENPRLKKELTKKIILDLSGVELDQNNQDFVAVSFTICAKCFSGNVSKLLFRQ